MIDVHTGVDYGNDPRAADSEAVLRIGQANDLPGRLRRVTVRDRSAEIVYRRGIGQPVWRVIDGWQWNWQRLVGLNDLDSHQRLEELNYATHQRMQQITSAG